MKRPTLLFILAALAVLPACTAHATSLLLDFGPTAVVPVDALRSPAHAAGIVPASEITWNRIIGDSNTLYYGDGTLATGVTIDLGRSTAVGPVGDDTINFSDNAFTVSALAGTVNTGVYAGTSPVRDGIFGGANGTNNLALGLRIDGLPAGTYRVVVHGRNTSTGTQAGLLFYAMAGASAGTYAFSMADTTAVLSNTAPVIVSGFVEGDNFGVMVITLTAGQSLYIASEGTFPAEMRGFFNAISIVSGAPNLPAKISAHPAARTIMETATATLLADGWGAPAVSYRQWLFNGTNVLVDGPNISGVHSNQLTLRNVTASMAGNYSLMISNSLGSDVSSNGLLTVTPVLNTDQMSNIWNLVPGDRQYISTASTERSLAFNSVTTHLLLASRTPSNQVVVLNPATGAENHFMDVSGIVDGTLVLNHVGVAADGAVFAANLTSTATSPPYKIYRWANDDPGVPATPVFIGDPGAGVQGNLRWGDNFAVRGAGSDTQILIAPGSGTNVALLRTTSGLDFQTEVPPTVIPITGVPANFGAITLGLAFGSGNSFWAKAASGSLYLIQFDLSSNTGAVVRTYATTLVPGSVRGIAVSADQKFLAGTAIETPNDNVRLYDISNLTNGPVLRDQEAFVPQNANANGTAASVFGGGYLFALDSNNGIKAFAINTNYVPPSVAIAAQPTDRTVMEGASATFTAVAASSQALTYRWRFNGTNLSDGPNVSGSATNLLTLRNVTTNSAGAYSLFVSNVFGTATSSNALLTVLPTFNTAQVSNIWSLEPGERTYLGTNTSTERGLAYNSVTTNLLLVSRLSADPTVVVLDAQTGAERHFLDTTGVPGTTAGVSLGLNTIGIADDGVVYGAGVTVSATSPPFYIYRWPNDTAGNPPVIVFAGDPGAPTEPNLGYADTMAVRGAGADTQILVAPRSGTNVVLLRSGSTMDFQTEVPPTVIAVSGVPNAFAQLGIAFGPGTNTFWAKTINNLLYLVEFDINTGAGTVLHAYSNAVPGNLRAISVDPNQKFLAGLATDTSVNVRIFDISDLTGGPILRDQEVYATSNPNVTVGGTGATTFGGNYLFALDSNNGIKAFLINTNYVPPLSPFPITSTTYNNGSVVFTWQSVVGHNYQVQSRDSLLATWGNLGGTITATASTTSFTNSTSGSDTRFYRVQGQ